MDDWVHGHFVCVARAMHRCWSITIFAASCESSSQQGGAVYLSSSTATFSGASFTSCSTVSTASLPIPYNRQSLTENLTLTLTLPSLPLCHPPHALLRCSQFIQQTIPDPNPDPNPDPAVVPLLPPSSRSHATRIVPTRCDADGTDGSSRPS